MRRWCFQMRKKMYITQRPGGFHFGYWLQFDGLSGKAWMRSKYTPYWQWCVDNEGKKKGKAEDGERGYKQ